MCSSDLFLAGVKAVKGEYPERRCREILQALGTATVDGLLRKGATNG